jgi:hypothetical protein
MKSSLGRKKSCEITNAKPLSKARKIIMRVAVFATTTCIGVGADELVKWAGGELWRLFWEVVRHLF